MRIRFSKKEKDKARRRAKRENEVSPSGQLHKIHEEKRRRVKHKKRITEEE